MPVKICEPEENLVYLNHIKINEEYRGCGIATFVINSIAEILDYGATHFCHVVVLKPAPYLLKEKDATYKNETKRLEEFYSKCGFKKYKNSGHLFKRIKN